MRGSRPRVLWFASRLPLWSCSGGLCAQLLVIIIVGMMVTTFGKLSGPFVSWLTKDEKGHLGGQAECQRGTFVDELLSGANVTAYDFEEVSCEVRHDMRLGMRIGEASHPGSGGKAAHRRKQWGFPIAEAHHAG